MKSIRKTIRFSEKEYAKIEKKVIRSDLNFSEFTLAALLEKEVRCKNDTELILQIARLGNNLNQITKKINSQDVPNSVIIFQLELIDKKLLELLS